MLKLPQQDYIKYLYENEDSNINQISKAMGINWRTAKKYAHQDDWNTVVKSVTRSSECKVMTDEFKVIVDTILQEEFNGAEKITS